MMQVAAYCRVSTDQTDQLHSFKSQRRYFADYIAGHTDWTLYRIYADEGVTGTSTKKRVAFNQMIANAKAGKFDLIVTKEVSRFSRNILDTIAYTRQLRAWGIGVLFLTDGINSLDADAELRLSLLGSIAQEESRKISAQVKWGQMRSMEQGVVFGRPLLGYDMQNGKLSVNPQGARLVQSIFYQYVYGGKSAAAIAKELTDAGCRTLTGGTSWRSSTILKILKNEKYCGDLLQKKTWTPDYLSHKKQYNHGEEPFVFLKDHHTAIVSRHVWETAQKEMARRCRKSRQETGSGRQHLLSGKLRCGICGHSFVAKKRTNSRGEYLVWRCSSPECSIGYQLRDDAALDAVYQAVETLPLDKEAVVTGVLDVVQTAAMDFKANRDVQIKEKEQRMQTAREKKKRVLDAFLAGCISEADMQFMNTALLL